MKRESDERTASDRGINDDSAGATERRSNRTSVPLEMISKTKETAASAIQSTTKTAASAIHSTKKTAASAIHSTTKKVKKTTHVVHETIETSSCLLPLKWLVHFPRSWPRTAAVIGVVLLLWILILISMGFGILLAQHESPTEISDNDAILSARAQIEYFDISGSKLLNVTNVCLARWEREVLDGTLNGEILQADESIVQDSLSNETVAEIADTNQEFLNENDQDGDGFVNINRTLLEVSMDRCARSFLPELQAFQETNTNNSIAFNSLSFNWNRCWDLRSNSQFVFYPSREMIQAAHPAQQEEYYEQEWRLMQETLYEKYLPELGDDYESYLRSVQEATGASACEENMGGTAWFFFTIMTTVGYGNQAPVTNDGRVLVVAAGLFSLILFGAVLGLCGYVLLAIFDDTVNRLGWTRFLGNPIVGMLLWGIIWLLFALGLAQDFEYWWEERLPEFSADISRGDTLWFAFISSSTIGLGDFFLQPEVVFASDTLKYSVLFMIGFVLLSTFFGKIAESLSLLLPTKHNSLEARLTNTRVMACWPRGLMPWESKPEQNTEDMVPDDQALIYRISQLKELKPDPPQGDESARGLVSQLTGNAITSLNVDLLKEEKSLLLEWLAVVEFQQQRAIRKQQEKANDSGSDDSEIIERGNGADNDDRKPHSEDTEESPASNSPPDSDGDEEGTAAGAEGEEAADRDDATTAEAETFNPLASFMKAT